MDHRGKIVIVTGASSGIGLVTARAFAERGATVVGVARREALLEKLITECRASSPDSIYLNGDLAEASFAEEIVDETVRRFGRLDILVNNAAVSKHKQIHHTTADEAAWVMRVNFESAMRSCLAAIPHMLAEGGGTIVNVSSTAAHIVPTREAIYAASKAALDAFSQGLALDLQGTDIHVANIIPGAIDTEIWDKEDEPVAFDGKKHPPEVVTRAIFEAIEKKKVELWAPRLDPPLLVARTLRALWPSMLRAGMRRMDPVPEDVVRRARERAKSGKRNGDLS